MYMINCYKTSLSEEQFMTLSFKEMKQLCQFDYAVEVTPEIFYSIQNGQLRFFPGRVDVEKHCKCVVYYLTRSFEQRSNHNED